MFFIGGFTSQRKHLDFYQSIICSHCKKLGRYEVFMEYMVFSLFFIPIIRWKRKYYVKTTCCQTVYSLNNDIGELIARGEDVTLAEENLQIIYEGYYHHTCHHCGANILSQYSYCPHCGAD